MLEFLTLLLQLLQSVTGDVATTTAAAVPSATTTAAVVRVIDGDTIDVQWRGTVERVRYLGIDTPEPYAGSAAECYAAAASAANRKLVADKTVSLVRDTENRDAYNRLLRYVYVDDTFVNAALVQSGHATALPIKPNTRYAQRFYKLEQAAAAEAVGLWSACR